MESDEKKKEKKALPVVAAYISTYLPSDMRHVFRQIVALQDFRAAVLARKRDNEVAFPIHKKWITMLPRPKSRAFRRWWFAKVKKTPIPLTDREVRDALYALSKHDAKLLHVYFGNIATQLLPLLRATRHPVVVSFHGADAGVDTQNPNYRAALEEVFVHAELVLARSEALLDNLRELGCPEEKLRLNRAGIPIGALRFVEREPPHAGGPWRFLQVCRLVEKKGLPVALRAFVKICGAVPEAEFHIAGGGPLREELGALAKELGVGDKVTFHGFLDMESLLELAHSSHVFLHPSQTAGDGNREGVPNAMLEAMATGLPVVATRHGGIPEAVEEGVSGMLVDEGDVDGLAFAALQLIAEPDRYLAYSRAASAAVEREFSLIKTMEALEGYYREAIEIAKAAGK